MSNKNDLKYIKCLLNYLIEGHSFKTVIRNVCNPNLRGEVHEILKPMIIKYGLSQISDVLNKIYINSQISRNNYNNKNLFEKKLPFKTIRDFEIIKPENSQSFNNLKSIIENDVINLSDDDTTTNSKKKKTRIAQKSEFNVLNFDKSNNNNNKDKLIEYSSLELNEDEKKITKFKKIKLGIKRGRKKKIKNYSAAEIKFNDPNLEPKLIGKMGKKVFFYKDNEDNNNSYKFYVAKIEKNGNVIFKCADLKCNSKAEINNEGKFKYTRKHSLKFLEHSYNQKKTIDDIKFSIQEQ